MQKNMANCDDSRCLAHWTIESSSYDRANQGNHTSLRMTLGHNTILGLVRVCGAKQACESAWERADARKSVVK